MINKTIITERNNQLKFSDWCLSFFIHLVIFVFLSMLVFKNGQNTPIIKSKPYKISFKGSQAKASRKKIRNKVTHSRSGNKVLSFDKLGALSMAPISANKGTSKRANSFKLLRLSKQPIRLQTRSQPFSQSKLQLQDLQENRIKSIRRSSFDISLEVPDGIAEDELNKIEQIFYSFRKRMVETYMSSFNRSLNDLEQSYPHYLKGLFDEKLTLTGKVSFDKDGNITKIRVLKKGRDSTLNQFFFDTLEGIKKLPNPPQDFVTNGKEFSIFYHLIIE